MSEQDDEQWITERDNEPGASFRTCMRAALARGYERGKAEREYEGQLLAIARQQRDDAKADRDRLAKRCEELDALLTRGVEIVEGDDATASRLAALEQRVGGIIEALLGCFGPDGAESYGDMARRLAALRAPGVASSEVDGLRAQLAAAERNEDRLTREALTARRERDEAREVLRRWVKWRNQPSMTSGDGDAIERDARRILAGQPVARDGDFGDRVEISAALQAAKVGGRTIIDGVKELIASLATRDAEIERLQERCRAAAHALVGAVGSATPANVEELAQRAATEIETLRAKLAEAERCAQESADIMRRARDRAESYCLRLGEAESQRDAFRAHAIKLDALCVRAANLLRDWCGTEPRALAEDIRARGEVPR